jgi:hypothetical protein
MAGTLQVNERSAWTPAGWIFNNVLERVALRIEPDDEDFATSVFDALGPMPGHLDLCNTPASQIQLLARATRDVCRRAEEAGPSAFPEGIFFDSFISELRRLQQLLNSDPRAGEE